MMTRLLLSAVTIFFIAGVAHAAVEPNYAPGKPPVTTPWFAKQTAAERQADLDFITGMRPHHEGALTMSEEYLESPKAGSAPLKRLAKGIIHNQKFEIGMLNRVEELVGAPLEEGKRRQIAEQGLAQKQRFVRAPMPRSSGGDAPVTVRDVQFAKAMIVHHEGALHMAQAYLDNPDANNRYLRLLCLDILLDQKQEIDFMKDVIGHYPGNPDDVKIDSSMIHGMDGMHHDVPDKTAVSPAKKVKKHAPPKGLMNGEAHQMTGQGHAHH